METINVDLFHNPDGSIPDIYIDNLMAGDIFMSNNTPCVLLSERAEDAYKVVDIETGRIAMISPGTKVDQAYSVCLRYKE